MLGCPIARMTRQRKAVLDTVRRLRGHPDASQVYHAARRIVPNVSLATVYRALEDLSAFGLISKVETPGARMRFDSNVSGHYHVQCVRCGRFVDAQAAAIDDVKDLVSKSTGFWIIGCRLDFSGICPRCRKHGRSTAAGRGDRGTRSD